MLTISKTTDRNDDTSVGVDFWSGYNNKPSVLMDRNVCAIHPKIGDQQIDIILRLVRIDRVSQSNIISGSVMVKCCLTNFSFEY